jgi:hypothetical protein
MAADSFEYYMVRVRRTETDPGWVSGQVERLGTGEKRSFSSGDHLAALVAAWPTSAPLVAGDAVPISHSDARRTSE